jgi:hypothetical protein
LTAECPCGWEDFLIEQRDVKQGDINFDRRGLSHDDTDGGAVPRPARLIGGCATSGQTYDIPEH